MLKPKPISVFAMTLLFAACTQTQGTPPPVTAGPMAASSSTVFTVALQPGSITGCILANPGMDRPMTLTVAGNKAALLTSGGVHYDLDRVQPNVYSGGYYIHISADLSGSPKRLTISNDDRSCNWAGTAA